MTPKTLLVIFLLVLQALNVYLCYLIYKQKKKERMGIEKTDV